MRKAWLACWGFVGVGVMVACGGSSDTDLFGSSGGSSGDATSSTSSSGSTTSSSGTTTSSSGGGSSSGSSTSSSGSSGATKDAGEAGCRPSVASDCPQTQYCKITTCGQTGGGQCVPKPVQLTDTYDPVCGCDNVTYWNEGVMASFGVSIKVKGICPSGKTCNGINKCPDKRYCNRDLGDGNALLCPGFTESGTCWGLPPNCPPLSGNRRPCGANPNQCKSFCDAIRAETPWYTDNAGCN